MKCRMRSPIFTHLAAKVCVLGATVSQVLLVYVYFVEKLCAWANVRPILEACSNLVCALHCVSICLKICVRLLCPLLH